MSTGERNRKERASRRRQAPGALASTIAWALLGCGSRSELEGFLPNDRWGTGSGGQTNTGGTEVGGSGGMPSGGSGGTPRSSGGLGSGGTPFPCGDGYYDSQWDPAPHCTPVSHCAPGYFVEREPTTITDRLCAPCEQGFSVEEDSRFCMSWSTCGFDDLIWAPGSAISDVVCENDLQVHAVPVSEYWPDLVSLPGKVVLLTLYGQTARFRSYSSPGLNLIADVPSSEYHPYQRATVLRRAAGDRFYYLDLTQIYRSPYGYLPSPSATLMDGGALQPVWKVVPGWHGGHAGATVLPDDTLASLMWTSEGYSWTANLARWSPAGDLTVQSLASTISEDQSGFLVGSNSSGNLHVLRTYPIDLVVLDPAGTELQTIDLSGIFSSVERGAVTSSGATYVGGTSLSGGYEMIRIGSDKSLTTMFRSASTTSFGLMATWNEDVIMGTCTDQPWNRALRGSTDALVVQYHPDGSEVQSWQVGGDGADCVRAGAVGDNGQITVVVDTDYSTLHLVELLP